MRNKIILIVFVLCFSALDMLAQRDGSRSNMLVSKSRTQQITLSSVSISAGYYKPSMDYWNNTFLPNSNTAGRFAGNSLISGNVSFDLPLNLGTRLGFWYWGDKINGVAGSSFSSLKINFTGVSAGVFYTYNKVFYGIKPYGGIDLSILMVQNKYKYDAFGDETKKSGNDFIATPFIGINKVIFDKIFIGLEYGYFLGRYLQDVETAASTTVKTTATNPVKIDGHKVQFTIGYKFR